MVWLRRAKPGSADLERRAAQGDQFGDAEGGFGELDFHIGGTRIDYAYALQAALVVLLIGSGLYLLWRLGRTAVKTCPDCKSELAQEASVCRYCTAELDEDE